MKIVASLIVHNEAGKFLKPCLESLLTFADEIRAVDDGSTDGSDEMMRDLGVRVWRNEQSVFYEHEGRARQRLLEWTMEANPSHIVVVDGDEVVVDGHKIREALEVPVEAPTMAQRRRGNRSHVESGVWSLNMQEVWGADENGLRIRQDGGWKEHPVPIVFAVPRLDRATLRHWRLPDRALACGRVPTEVAARSNRNHARPLTDLLHLGWSCEKDREARYQRYVKHDGGKHHAGSHLQSIMWDNTRVRLSHRQWPASLDDAKNSLLDRINQ